MEEEGPRGDMTIQSGLSNSTESIDSMKALTAAIEAANAQVRAVTFPMFSIRSSLKLPGTAVSLVSAPGPRTSQSACQQQHSQHPHPSAEQEASGGGAPR